MTKESILEKTQKIGMRKLKHPVREEGGWMRVTRNERMIIPKERKRKRKP